MFRWAGRLHRQRILENTAHGREMARRRGVKFGSATLPFPDCGHSNRKATRIDSGGAGAQAQRGASAASIVLGGEGEAAPLSSLPILSQEGVSGAG